GYGAAALGSLVNQDPSQYPDENPIIEKQGTGTSLSPQDIRDYADGVANSTDAQSFPASYVYRGADEGILFDQDRTIAVHLGTSPRYHRK
ncbi:MAG: alkaline protease, partial [Actinomyces sp.]|nr:alkaline protease [Actinomyces sp.]